MLPKWSVYANRYDYIPCARWKDHTRPVILNLAIYVSHSIYAIPKHVMSFHYVLLAINLSEKIFPTYSIGGKVHTCQAITSL